MAKVTLTDEEIDALRSVHGEVAAADTILGTAVFRAPTPEEYQTAMKMRTHPTQGPHAGPWIASECVVHPSKDEWKEWVAKRSGIARSVQVDNAIHRLVGLDEFAIAQLSSDGETVTVATMLGNATFKPADDRQLREYDKKKDGTEPLTAVDYLATACVVSPDRATFQQWLAQKPGISATCLPHIRRLTGLEADERLKG